MTAYIVLYDADCDLCTRFKNTLDFLDAHKNLDFMSIEKAEKIGLLDSLPDPKRHRSFHLVLPDRRVMSGDNALPALIRLLPAGRLVVNIIVSAPKGQKALGLVYSTVSRLHDVGKCKMQDRTVGHVSSLGLETHLGSG